MVVSSVSFWNMSQLWSLRRSGATPTGAATTGTEQAAASRFTRAKFSALLGFINMFRPID